MRMLMTISTRTLPSGLRIWLFMAARGRRLGIGMLSRYRPGVKSLGERRDFARAIRQTSRVFKTHEYAPRVLIANSNLVGHFSNWEKFNELERAGLMMYGQMTAGSWIYIGSQGIVQGTYETFNAAGDKHFGGDLSGQADRLRRNGRNGGAQTARRDDDRRCVLGSTSILSASRSA